MASASLRSVNRQRIATILPQPIHPAAALAARLRVGLEEKEETVPQAAFEKGPQAIAIGSQALFFVRPTPVAVITSLWSR
jgi:hypothetical protein